MCTPNFVHMMCTPNVVYLWLCNKFTDRAIQKLKYTKMYK